MKKCILVVSILLVLLGQATVEAQEAKDKKCKGGNIQLWGSAGPKDYKNSSSFALGVRLGSFGLEGGHAGKGDYTPEDVLDYRVPHSHYVILGEKSIGKTTGFDVIWFYNPATSISIFAGCGMYLQEYRVVAKSLITSWLYTQSKFTERYFVPSVGIFYFPATNISVGIGYHPIRGLNGRIGLGF